MDEPETPSPANRRPIPYVELPPELLSKIFVTCAALPPRKNLDEPWMTSHQYSTKSIQWIAVSHVCRYWRYVALDCADLWRRLVFFNLDVTKEMIRRSKGANLEVIIIEQPRSKPSADVILQTVRPESHRISVLHLETRGYPCFYDTIVSAAPNLESLTLGFRNLLGPPDKLSVPDTIFSLKTPALRSLELRDWVWASRSPSSIISQIISFLRQTPMLHTLILDMVQPGNLSADIEYPKVILPELSQLTLSNSIAFCTKLLECLILPITTAASFKCVEEPTHRNGDYHGLFRALCSAIGNGEVEFTVSTLSICDGDTELCLDYKVTNPRSCAQTAIMFRFMAIYDFFENYNDVFDTARITFPLADVHELVVGELGDESFWLTNVRDLPNLHSIRFTALLPRFVAALGHLDSPILPRLHSLQFDGVNFRFKGTLDLLESLETRCQFGLSINTIHLRQCSNLFEYDVKCMKEFVQVVDWDGVEIDDEDNFYTYV